MRIAVVTGEPSGRLYAGLVEEALATAASDTEIIRLEAAERRDTVLGFIEGIRSAPRLTRRLSAVRRHIAGIDPDLVLLAGFSNFNLPLGRACRRAGLPVAFLAPPQLWAWGSWRCALLRRAADLVICLFPFEADWLRRHGVRATFTGNPLAEAVRTSESRSAHPAWARTLERAGLRPDERYIVFLPGSRPSELAHHNRLFDTVKMHGYRSIRLAPASPLAPCRYDLLAHAEAGVVVSGTATLEAALLGLPQVACYHLGGPTRLLARLLVRTRRFALPNILLRRDAVPELLEPTSNAISRALRKLLSDPGCRSRARQDARELSGLLGPPGAAGRIARLLLDLTGL